MKKVVFLIFCVLCTIGVNAQTDSIGVYSVHGSNVKRVEIAKPIATKVSSAVVAGKVRLEFDKATSDVQFQDTATFRIYYNTPSPYEAVKYYMFTPMYSAKDLSVGQFSVKKNSRYLTSSTISIIGGTMGIKKAKDVQVETRLLRPNVYEMVIVAPAGEYCILPILNGMLNAHSGVFAFTIKTE